MTGFILVTTTAPTRESAAAIAQALVAERLAACTQVIGPIQSAYWWEGKLESSEEWLCLAKSRRDLFSATETAIRALHPYQVPQVVAVEIAAGSQAYLDWLGAELAPPAPRPA
jgi:periplasmic divalent cation tolerance protein